jgi:hypothetical protein
MLSKGEEENLKKVHLCVMALIIINAILGLAVMFLSVGDHLAVVNYFMFCLIAYFYYLTKKSVCIPFFIFECFTFSLLLIDDLMPNGLVDSSNDFQNNFMIVVGLIAFSIFAIETIKIMKNS